MKISITDKFLWEIYNYIEKVGDVIDFSFRSPTARNFLPGDKNPIFKKYRNDRNKREFNNLVYYLKSRGYIKIDNLKNKKALILTKEGASKALKASFKLDKKRRSDGKWTMLIFDIPENRRKLRGLLRSVIYNAGFKMLQKSVWISPYEVSDKIEKYLAIYNLDDYVKTFLVEGL